MSLRFGEFELDQERRQLLRSGRPVPLEPKHYEVLTVLLERRPRALSRIEIRDVVWPETFVSESTLTLAITSIRQALGDDARNPRFVRTVHGFGYAFCGEAHESTDGRPGPVAAPLVESSPYPGLSAFTEAEAELFYGREKEVSALWDRIREQTMLAVIGSSGAGKSSLVRAGIAAGRPEGWAALVTTPGASPMRSLARALAARMEPDPEAVQAFLDFEDPEVALQLFSRWRARHGEALVVVDQFEELFTLCPPEIQAGFATFLGRLADEGCVHVLLSLRDDFLIRCREHPSLAPVFEHLTALISLTGEDLRRALEEPARQRGYAFEDGSLARDMVKGAEGARAPLPLLAFAAAQLWDGRDGEGRVLTRAAYDAIGGVAGALARHAEQTLERIGPEKTPAVRELFRNLVTAQGTRAVAEREALLSVFPEPEVAVPVLDALISARLLTSYENDQDDEGSGAQRIEITHESLLESWPRLVRWQAQEAEGALLRDQLRQASRLWDEKGRPDDLLWSGTPWLEYRAWRARYPGGLSAAEEDFARAMAVLANRRRRRRRAAAIAAVAAAALVAIVTSLLWRRAETETLRAEASNLLSLGRLELEESPSTALAYAIASLERADNEPAKRLALRALWSGPLAFQIAPRQAFVNWSPDGEWLALRGFEDVDLFLNRDASERYELDLDGHLVGFTNDSSGIVTHDGQTEVVLWSFPRLERLKSWEILGLGQDTYEGVHDRMLLTVEHDPSTPQPLVGRVRPIDGDSVRTLGRWAEGPDTGGLDSGLEWRASVEDGRVVKRRLGAPGAPPRVLGRHEGAVALQWNPWGDRLATADESGLVQIWNAESGGLVRTLRSPASARTIRLDPSGRYVAAAPAFGQLSPGSLAVFDLDAPGGASPIILRHEVGTLNDMSFHPEGHYLATGNFPHGVFLWNLAPRRSIVLPDGDIGDLPGAKFLPDGRLVYVPRSGSVRLWPLWTATGDAPRTLWTPRLGPDVIYVDISDDGQDLAIFERQAGELTVLPLDGSPGVVHKLDFGTPVAVNLAPDGRRAAYLRIDPGDPGNNSLRILNLETDEETALPRGDMTGVCELKGWGRILAELPEWLPDGRLVSYGTAGLRLWDLEKMSSQQLLPCLDTGGGGYQVIASADGKTVLTLASPNSTRSSEPSTLRAFDLDTRQGSEITGHGRRVSAMALDETGTVLLTGDTEGVVRVGRLDGGEPHLLLGHMGPVGSVDASPDGRWVASAAVDGTIRLWPMPDLTKPPLHTVPARELLAKLYKMTNLRVVEDPDSDSGYDVEPGPFQGWAQPPTW